MTAKGSARLITSAAEIGAARWNALANPQGLAEPHPFTTFEFFEAVEASGSACRETGWQPAHLLTDDGLMPLYVKNHSQGEYVFDHAWADALERAGGDYYPKLQACVPFTPVTGPRLLGNRESLLKTAAGAVKQIGASSLHITFLTREEWQAAGDAGYLLRTGQQFHWENRDYRSFDEFLGELSSAKRKTLRKERASVAAAGVSFDWLTGADITEAHWDQFFDFYMDTGGRKWGTPYLTRDFFSRLGQGLGKQTLLIMAKQDGRYIAGALNLFGEGVLFGRNWGAGDYVPFLHFETCYYQAIDFAIARGLKRVEAGAQGEHKLLRGYLPVETYSAHLVAHPGLARAVNNFLAAERAAVTENMAELAAHAPFKKRILMAYDHDNIFAKILRGEIPAVKVYEDDKTLAFMDVMPEAEGHVLVVPREDAQDILDLSAGGMAAMMATVQKVARAVDKALSPDGILLKQYNRAPAGQSIFHVHFHIVPRWEGTALAPHGKAMVEAAKLEPIAAKIRSAL